MKNLKVQRLQSRVLLKVGMIVTILLLRVAFLVLLMVVTRNKNYQIMFQFTQGVTKEVIKDLRLIVNKEFKIIQMSTIKLKKIYHS